MAEELKERCEMDPRYTWDLSDLYENDEAWEAAFATADEKIAALAAFAGKLNNAKDIRDYMDAEVQTGLLIEDLYSYANLRKCEDTRAEAAQKLDARAMSKYVQFVTAVSFAEPEILSLPEEQLAAIAEDPLLAPYHYNVKRMLDRKPHVLSMAEERLLARFAESIGSPATVSENLMDADMVFDDAKDSEGNPAEVSSASYVVLQMSQDRALRESAFRSLYKGYRQHVNTLAATYAGAVKAATAEAEVRHYGSSREMSLSMNEIPLFVYDNLVEAVHRHMPAMHRYAALRKQILGLDELHYYDVYTPLVEGDEKRYTYEEAQELVLKAVEPLGKEYGDIVREAFANRWIDVYPNRGKRSGAFSAGTYDSLPHILTNYTGTLDSVSTIAHEMGHSLHTWHSTHTQPPQYADYTLFVAEVASTVNENLLIEHLLSVTEDPKARLVLLNQYLENFKGTVYRQTMFAEFEMRAHALAEEGAALDPATLCDLYRGLVEDYFGEALVMDDEVAYEWARIPHFYRPFYVYVYATGYCTAVALSEGIRTEAARLAAEGKDPEDNQAVKRYREFLSMGSSQPPLDELAHAGVDLHTPDALDASLAKFEAVLAEAEAIAAKLAAE